MQSVSHQHKEPHTFHDFEKLLKNYPVKTQWKKVIVAFGDIINFAPWLRRAINTPEEKKFLVTRLYSKLTYMRHEKNMFTKGLGDGAMIVQELGKGDESLLVANFLREMKYFKTYMDEVMARLSYPKPQGFRIRVCVGHALKLFLNNCPNMCTLKVDYVEYPITLASRMLMISKKEHPFICHEAVKELLGNRAEKEGISFKPVEIEAKVKFLELTAALHVDGIDKEDLDVLWLFDVADKPKESEKLKKRVRS